MKTVLKSIIIVSALCFAGNTASAQTLKDLLKNATNNTTVTEIVEKVTGVDLSKGDIKGTWNYTGSAVKLESEDVLKSAAAGAVTGQIEKKLDEFLEKAGLKSGTFSFTFNEDNTFATTVKEKSFNGTYTLSEDGNTLNLKYGKSLNSTGITATAQINDKTFELLFKADKLLDLLGKLTSNTENSTLKTMGALVGQYDGMKIGLELQK